MVTKWKVNEAVKIPGVREADYSEHEVLPEDDYYTHMCIYM